MNAISELLATLTDGVAEGWQAADFGARLEEWRRMVTRPEAADAPAIVAETPQERAVVILALVRARGQVTNGELCETLPYWHAETLRLDCARLVSLGLLQKSGRRKATRYTPGARLEEWRGLPAEVAQ